MITNGSPAPGVDYAALAAFRYEMRRFLRVSEEAAWAAGLEPRQHQLLLAVKGTLPGEQPTVAYLAERLQLQHHSVVGLVDRLAARRLVRRRRDPTDRRRAIVSLTTRGEATVHALSVVHQEEIRSRAPALLTAMEAIARAHKFGRKNRSVRKHPTQ